MSAALELPPSPVEVERKANYRIRAVTGLAGLAQLADDWRELGSEVGGPIEQYEWAAATAATGCEAECVRLIAASQDNGWQPWRFWKRSVSSACGAR
jgi:hypothetical protein